MSENTSQPQPKEQIPSRAKKSPSPKPVTGEQPSKGPRPHHENPEAEGVQRVSNRRDRKDPNVLPEQPNYPKK